MQRSKPKPDSGPAADAAAARSRAVQLLAAREHSALELRHKLGDRGFPLQVVDTVLAQLAADGLQSDARFVEQYVRSRVRRGFGPVRIRAELRERGIGEALIAPQLDAWDWAAQAEGARCKRFGGGVPREWKERARQARFLQMRGFGSEHMGALFAQLPGD